MSYVIVAIIVCITHAMIYAYGVTVGQGIEIDKQRDRLLKGGER